MGSTESSTLTCLTVDASNNLYTGFVTNIYKTSLVAGASNGCAVATIPTGSVASAIVADTLGNIFVSFAGTVVKYPVGFTVSTVPSTVAGNGASSGTCTSVSVAATSAYLQGPQQLAVDMSNNLYIAGGQCGQVYFVDLVATPPRLTIVAGSVNGPDKWDPRFEGGPATSAKFSNQVNGVAYDPSGAGFLYVVDGGPVYPVVVRVDLASGTISTLLAGSAGANANTVAFNPVTKTVYVAYSNRGQIVALAIRVHARFGLGRSTAVIYTIAGGNGPVATKSLIAALSAPANTVDFSSLYNVAVDVSSNVYFWSGTFVGKIAPDAVTGLLDIAPNAVTGLVTGTSTLTVYGTTTNYCGSSSGSCQIAVDTSGNIYYPDNSASYCYKVTSSGVSTTFAGNGRSPTANNNVAGSSSGGPATSAALGSVYGIAVDATGRNIYLTRGSTHAVGQVNSTRYYTVVGEATTPSSGGCLAGRAYDAKVRIDPPG